MGGGQGRHTRHEGEADRNLEAVPEADCEGITYT